MTVTDLRQKMGTHRVGGIDRENLPDDEIVEQHADRGEIAADSTGVLPRLTECFGPRTAWAGLMARI